MGLKILLTSFFSGETRLFDYSEEQLVLSTVYLLDSTDLLRAHRVSRNKLLSFCEHVQKAYEDVPYHNFYHGFNVFQVCLMFLHNTKVTSLGTLERLGLLIGAFCHDMGHKGVNNGFHINSFEKDPMIEDLAIQPIDIAVLENMHASLAFQAMKAPERAIFENLSRQEKRQIRTVMCRGILATDMAQHMAHVKAFKQKAEFDGASNEDRIMIVEILLHNFDLSNQHSQEQMR